MLGHAVEFDDAAIEEERRRIIGPRMTIAEIARINGQSERSVYDNLQRLGIPFIKLGPVIYIDPVLYAERRGRQDREPRAEPEPLPPPRRVGRPRKLEK